jgi:hypothetical protein
MSSQDTPQTNANLLRRVIPVVNTHHGDIDELKLRLGVTERKVTELQITLQRVEAFVSGIMASQMGTGATSTEV